MSGEGPLFPTKDRCPRRRTAVLYAAARPPTEERHDMTGDGVHGSATAIEVVQGDITRIRVDAVVNAANSSRLGGGGVDGAIHRAGGREILAECEELRRTTLPDGLPTGDAVATTAGRLPARWVIHTVGPVYRSGGTEK